MKSLLFLICAFFILTNCKKKSLTKNSKDIVLQEFKIDSTSIRAIVALNTKTLYFAGSNGKIGSTTDAGKSWNIKTINYKDSIAPHFRSIAKNKNHIFALSIGNPALLYKITNKKAQLVYTEKHPKVFYDCLKFFDDTKHAIAVGDPTENCPSIILSSDSGNTWTKIPCNKLPIFKEGEAFFAASNTNIKIINNTVWIASGGKKSRILKSEDKGKTWQIITTPIIQGSSSQGIYSIDFADKNNGVAIGGDYLNPEDNCKNKIQTTDGGKTWKVIADNLNPNYKSCIQYVPETNGKQIIAVGKTGISFSKNGGESWSTISNKSYYTIQFINKNTAWLAGKNKIGKLTLL